MSRFAQLLAGAVDAAFDCAHGEVERFCDFFVFVAFYEHLKGAGVDGFELIDQRLQFAYGEQGRALVGGSLVCLLKQMAARGCRGRVAVALLAINVDEGVAHDGGQPGVEVGAHLKFVAMGECPHGSFLNEVFGVFAIVGQLIGQAHELMLKVVKLAVEFSDSHFVLWFCLRPLEGVLRFRKTPSPRFQIGFRECVVLIQSCCRVKSAAMARMSHKPMKKTATSISQKNSQKLLQPTTCVTGHVVCST